MLGSYFLRKSMSRRNTPRLRCTAVWFMKVSVMSAWAHHPAIERSQPYLEVEPIPGYQPCSYAMSASLFFETKQGDHSTY